MMIAIIILAATRLALGKYSYPSPSEEKTLARACGHSNLSSLAAPVPGMTAGEVPLLFGGHLRLLEQVAPHLLWLRRGPLFAEDKAGSVLLSPARLPGASFTHTTTFKLRHDIEQFEYLAERGWRSKWLTETILPAYRQVLSRAEDDFGDYYALSPLDKLLIGTTYNRALLFDDDTYLSGLERRSDGVFNDAVPFDAADQGYASGLGHSVIFVDDVLKPDVLADVLEYCKSATLFYETKIHTAGGHLGAYVTDGLAAPVLLQIADDLRRLLPKTLGSLPLRNLWAYKYTESQRGIMIHKDQAKVNVNLWISPTDANLDKERGGLKIYDAPLFMEPAVTPVDLVGDLGDQKLADFPNVTVPFRQNRMTIFDSALPHKSDIGLWAPGYDNRRISITFLFGTPEMSTT